MCIALANWGASTKFERPIPAAARESVVDIGFTTFHIRYLAVIVLALLSDKDVEANIAPVEQSALRSLAGQLRREVERYVQHKR